MVGQLRMTFLEHLEELKHRVKICLVAFLVVFGAVYMLSVKFTTLWGYTIPYLYPDFFHNIPAQLFAEFKADLLPDNIILLNIGGIDALIVDVKLAMFLAFAICTPIFAWQIGKFITPALFPRERRFIAKIVLPTTILFIIGALFSYFFFTPIAMDFFFTYSEQLDVGIPITDPVTNETTIWPTIGVSNFLSWITIMVLAFGIIFELPVFMAALTRLGIVSAKKWKDGWRYAIVAFLVIGGLITPDVSGVTQIFVAIPMTCLYILGIGMAMYIEKKKREREKEL
jgi:sec-independent protein translocase protein TatC